MTFDAYVRTHCTRKMPESSTHGGTKTLTPQESTTNDTPLLQHQASDDKRRTESETEERDNQRDDECVGEGYKKRRKLDDAADEPSEMLAGRTETRPGGVVEKAVATWRYEEGAIERVVFIDSTWHQVHRIATDERLRGKRGDEATLVVLC